MRLPAFKSSASRHPVAAFTAWLLVTFLVLFPKGGFKIGDVPITWGYILLALCSPPLLTARLLAFSLKFPIRLVGALVCTAPFQLIFLYAAVAHGVVEPSVFVSSAIDFFYLPLMFLLLFPWFFDRLDGVRLSRHFRFCVLAAAIFGILMFFYHPIVGSFIEIPYLTVNSGDYGELERRKHIVRGTFLKLISTYNNGNLYGVATLILLPIFNALEPKRWKRYVLIVALVLTLSRTVWAGLIFQEVITLTLVLGKSLKRFPRMVAGPAIRSVFAVAAMVVLVLVGLLFNANNLSFLFDSSLGGREGTLLAFSHPTWIPMEPPGGFAEIVYASAIASFGISGLLALLLLFAGPILLYLAQPAAYRSPLQRAALQSLVIYPFLAGSDGAINLIPVLTFYWFAYMIFLFGWPGHPPAALRTAPSLPSPQQELTPLRNSTATARAPAWSGR